MSSCAHCGLVARYRKGCCGVRYCSSGCMNADAETHICYEYDLRCSACLCLLSGPTAYSKTYKKVEYYFCGSQCRAGKPPAKATAEPPIAISVRSAESIPVHRDMDQKSQLAEAPPAIGDHVSDIRPSVVYQTAAASCCIEYNFNGLDTNRIKKMWSNITARV